VYQLSPGSPTEGRRTSVGQHLRGRVLFHADLDHETLVHRLENRARIKRTKLTEEFTLADFEEMYGETAAPLFLIEDGKRLRVCATDGSVTPQAGHTVIALVDMDESRKIE
jgi:hypothetical protein